jgi:hypothetical protein
VLSLSSLTFTSVTAAEAGPAAAIIAIGAPTTPIAARPAIFDARLGAACRDRAVFVIRVLMFLRGANIGPDVISREPSWGAATT